ncbi:hypothetical protein CI610_02165 [invertebrate metagenome]|uniref:Transposase n=1 Tax=invertebrate metagenome TaxID=1711999 RepID=A0A2H9T6P0_9ZZZZ
MDASDIKQMKDLEEENRRLKQMFSDFNLSCRSAKNDQPIIKQFQAALKHYPAYVFGQLLRY